MCKGTAGAPATAHDRMTILDGWDAVLTHGADVAARIHEEIRR